MSTRSVLKVAALVGGIAWAIYLAIQWNDYLSAMSQIKDSVFGKMAIALGKESIESVRNRLIVQSIGALILIGIGIGIKGDEENSGTPVAKSLKFEGTQDLSNDAYKIFLVERYAINKNDVLGGFTLNGTIHKSLDEALNAAHAIHCPVGKSEPALPINSTSEPVTSQIEKVEPEHKTKPTNQENGKINLITSNTRIVGLSVLVLFAVGASFFYSQHKGGLSEKQISDALQGTWGNPSCDEAKTLVTFSFSNPNQFDQFGTRTDTSSITYKEEKSKIESSGGLKFIKKISSWDGGNRSGSSGQFEYEFTDASLSKIFIVRGELIDSKGEKSVSEIRNGKRYTKSWGESEFKEQDIGLPTVKCPNNKDYLQSKNHAIEAGWYIELAGFGDTDEAKQRVVELNKEFETLKVVWTFPVKTQRGTYSIVVNKAFQSDADAGTQRMKFEELFGKKGIRLDSNLISSSEIKSRI